MSQMIEAREWPTDAPRFKSKAVTLIADSGAGLVFAVNVGEKRELLSNTTGPLWAVWNGQWSSHLFVVSRSAATEEVL